MQPTLLISKSELPLNLLVVDEWDALPVDLEVAPLAHEPLDGCDEWDALPVDLEVAPLAHEPLDGCDGWVAVGDVRLDELEHASTTSTTSTASCLRTRCPF